MSQTPRTPTASKSGLLGQILGGGIGLIIIVLVLWGVYRGISAAWQQIFPPPPVAAVSLTGYFETVEDRSVLRIEGCVPDLVEFSLA